MTDKQHSDREITYRVGWKKGKILVQDFSAGEHKPAESAAVPEPAPLPVHRWNKAMRIIWKRAPQPTLRLSAGIAVILPAAAFAAILWLVAQLAAIR
jgi:hypothetical protein